MLGWGYWLGLAGVWVCGFGCGVLWFAVYAVRHGAKPTRNPWNPDRGDE
ncbi:hypothetical protein SCMU_14340 [Sinomonas cyclohexanicum]|uniref:Uncharacterized protein n=1 Tax=Sinomonas cyclohexanicum TaxID=322009 RepID=A0ABN6FFA5_SINCY|nr:hypothetical protein SCMU_14340 [Corynebacterium cyclohexanicum]